jgi:hypothetical protein
LEAPRRDDLTPTGRMRARKDGSMPAASEDEGAEHDGPELGRVLINRDR